MTLSATSAERPAAPLRAEGLTVELGLAELIPVRGERLRPRSPGGCVFAIGAPTGHSQPPAPAESNRRRLAGKPAGSLSIGPGEVLAQQ